MSAIHQHGLIWKDTYPGVWTAMGELLGKPAIFYAAEIITEDDTQIAATEEGSRVLDATRMLSGYQFYRHGTIRLGDMDCVVSVAVE